MAIAALVTKYRGTVQIARGVATYRVTRRLRDLNCFDVKVNRRYAGQVICRLRAAVMTSM